MAKPSYLQQPSNFRPSPPEFRCGERLEDETFGRSGVSFFCTLPRSKDSNDNEHEVSNKHLTFSCRDRSCGVLENQESAVTNEQFEATQNSTAVDPFFFDKGYTLAGRTGFQVWSGTRLMIESLLFPLPDDNDRLITIQNSLSTKKIIELGAGVGVVGTALAFSGCQVLLSDLPTLVEHSLLPNLICNREIEREIRSTKEPKWLHNASHNLRFEETEDNETVIFPIGNKGGWASIATIDWTEPLNGQLSSINSLDWIIASDCVWLVSMLESLLNTVDSLFRKNKNARLLLSFQRRESTDSSRFSSVSSIVNSIQEREWSLDCLAWRHVRQEGENEPKEVFVFEIAPLRRNL